MTIFIKNKSFLLSCTLLLLVGFLSGPVFSGCKSNADCSEGEICCKVGLRSTCIEPENCFNYKPEFSGKFLNLTSEFNTQSQDKSILISNNNFLNSKYFNYQACSNY